MEAVIDKVSEDGRPLGRRQLRRLVLSNVVQGTHRVHVEVGRFALGQLDARDAQRPHVHLAVILALVHRQDHLRRHPVRRPHK